MAFIVPYKDKTPKIAQDVFVAPTAAIVGDVEIGEGSSVWFGVSIRGDFMPIRIGKLTNIQDNSTIHTTAHHHLVIGDEVIIGHNRIIHATEIGSHVFVGMGSIILGHVRIGDNVIIGPGSLIPEGRRIPHDSLVFGEPARLIRSLRDDEIEALHASSLNYHEFSKTYQEIFEKYKDQAELL